MVRHTHTEITSAFSLFVHFDWEQSLSVALLPFPTSLLSCEAGSKSPSNTELCVMFFSYAFEIRRTHTHRAGKTKKMDSVILL